MSKKEQVLEKHKEGLTNLEISNITGYTTACINAIINHAGLKSNRESVGNILDSKFYEFILGSMLGDGHIDVHGRLSLIHGPKQLEYINYKYMFIETYRLAGKFCFHRDINDRYINGYTDIYRFRTKTSDKMKPLRKLYYPNNKKKVPDKDYLLQYLSPFALAIWYMDDGNVCNYNLQINTQGFSVKERLLLQEVLLEKYAVVVSIPPIGQLTIKAESIPTFVSLISSYVIPSMMYKLVPYRRRVLNKLGELQERCDANLQPSLDSNIFEGSTTNDQVLIEDGNIDTSAQPCTAGDDIVCSIEKRESIELQDKEPVS